MDAIAQTVGREGEGRGLDRADATPLYHQLHLRLRDEIVSGRLTDGAAAPTEHELSRLYGVSRITARRALDELAAAGLVVRRRRIGTRVTFGGAPTPIQADVRQAVDSLIAFGRSNTVKLVELAAEPADAVAREHLRLEPEAPVIRAVRVRSLDEGPLGYVVSYMPSDVGKGFDRSALESTPVLDLLRGSGVRLGGGAQTILAVAATPVIAAALQVEHRSPLLLVRRVLEDATGRPVLLTLAHYRADRYEIRVDLTAQNYAAAPEANSASIRSLERPAAASTSRD